MVLVSAGHVGGTRGLGIASSATDVLGMRAVGGVCVMCICSDLGGVSGGGGGEWMSGLGLGFSNPVGTGECWTCVCLAVV